VAGTDGKVRLWRFFWPEDLINEACQRLTVSACESSTDQKSPWSLPFPFSIPSRPVAALPRHPVSTRLAENELPQTEEPAVRPHEATNSYRLQIHLNGKPISFKSLNEDRTEAGRSSSKLREVILKPGAYTLRADQFEIKKIMLPSSCIPPSTEDDAFAERHINAKNANLWLAYQDGPFRRDYNSRSVYKGPLGFGWTFGSRRWGFGSKLERMREGGFKIIEVDGHETLYERDTTALHTSADPFQSVLVEEPGRLIRSLKDHGYQKRYGPDVKREVFDPKGRLRSVQYWNGEAHGMHYKGDSLQAIVNQWTGKTAASFEWKNGQIVEARDSGGQSFQYRYDGHHLVSVTGPDGAVTRYRYDDRSNLTELALPQRHAVFHYDKKRDFLIRLQVARMDYRLEYGQESVHHYWTIRTDNRGNLVRWDYHDDSTLVTTAKCLDEKLS
jgi:YD repeat-containing protein